MNANRSPSYERGAAAVELALVLPILVALLSAAFFFGRVCYHYTAMQKAAQDAARYLSSISAQEMRERDMAEAAEAVALEIIRQELEELNPGRYPAQVTISCGDTRCDGVGGRPLPETVNVRIEVDMFDFLNLIDVGRYGVPLTADSTMRYVGPGG